MTRRLRHSILIALAACLTAAPVAYSLTGTSRVGPATPGQLASGKKLYRQYCGQCHALAQALSAGFGSNNGLGRDGGPSFKTLKVPYNLTIVVVTETYPGHEVVTTRMRWTQLSDVAKFLASATKNNPHLARPSDE